MKPSPHPSPRRGEGAHHARVLIRTIRHDNGSYAVAFISSSLAWISGSFAKARVDGLIAEIARRHAAIGVEQRHEHGERARGEVDRGAVGARAVVQDQRAAVAGIIELQHHAHLPGPRVLLDKAFQGEYLWFIPQDALDDETAV